MLAIGASLIQNYSWLAGRLLGGVSPDTEKKEDPLMTLLTLSFVAVTLASAQPPDCSSSSVVRPEAHVYTNADLDRMSACRYQTGVLSETAAEPVATRSASRKGVARSSSSSNPRTDRETSEADWRARWRSVDQKARKLRREADQLRQEAAEAQRDRKKQPQGRRSPSLLLGRARSLEADARDLEDEFQERARGEGALPGWLRPKSR